MNRGRYLLFALTLIIECFPAFAQQRRARYNNIQRVENIWTAHTIEMFVAQTRRTILAIENLQYNLPMKDENFTLQGLRREF